MAARLDQPAMVEYRDLIAEAAGGEAVGDINCRLCSDELIKPLIDFMLRHRVERGGRLVEDDKGRILVERAGHEPNTLFIGMDQEPICIAYAAQKICEQELSNVLVLPRGAASLPQLFAAGELDAITINFPTPQPKAKYAKKRLVHVDHLMLYRPLFAAGATVTLRTDSKPLRDYALGQFAAAGYDTLWVSDDVRRDHPEHPETEYERRTREMGAAVYGICATPGAQPSDEQLAAGRAQEQSLACYLPDNLDELAYVPLGMEEAVENFKNRARKGKKRLPQER